MDISFKKLTDNKRPGIKSSPLTQELEGNGLGCQKASPDIKADKGIPGALYPMISDTKAYQEPDKSVPCDLLRAGSPSFESHGVPYTSN